MTNLYFINDGSNNNAGWCTSMREAKSARANLIRACGSEYADTDIETHAVSAMSAAKLGSIASSTSAPVPARRIAKRELSRRGE